MSSAGANKIVSYRAMVQGLEQLLAEQKRPGFNPSSFPTLSCAACVNNNHSPWKKCHPIGRKEMSMVGMLFELMSGKDMSPNHETLAKEQVHNV